MPRIARLLRMWWQAPVAITSAVASFALMLYANESAAFSIARNGTVSNTSFSTLWYSLSIGLAVVAALTGIVAGLRVHWMLEPKRNPKVRGFELVVKDSNKIAE